MKILVISDTHGHIDKVVRYIKAHEDQLDAIWHLGDHFRDAKRIELLTGKTVLGVRGNCDGFSEAEEELTLHFEGYKILLTHGHHYGVKYSMLRLHLKAMESGYHLICFGHTHVAAEFHEDGVTFLNPGSVSQPRATKYGSVAIIDLDKNGIKTHIIPMGMHE